MVIRTSQINDYGFLLMDELIKEAREDGQTVIVLLDKPSPAGGTIMENADIVIDCLGYVPSELKNKYGSVPTKVVKETLVMVDIVEDEISE
jgi:hypothetical protein